MRGVPHVVPYQGSKRSQAAIIVSYMKGLSPRPVRLIEPFVGSAAVTLAAAAAGVCERYVLGDSLPALAGIWGEVIARPAELADRYAEIWGGEGEGYFERVRAEFNVDGEPAKLLYLVARCVKNAIRFNKDGQFNQSADQRRRGTRPERLRASILAAHQLLADRAEVIAGDYDARLDAAQPGDVVYLDPPYQGTSAKRDQRYFQPLDLDRFIRSIERLNQRGVPFLISFDGRCGDKVYGPPLPAHLNLYHTEIEVGPSAQATLHGRSARTVESLYRSRHFA